MHCGKPWPEARGTSGKCDGCKWPNGSRSSLAKVRLYVHPTHYI